MASTRTIALAATSLLAVVAAAVIGANAGSKHADNVADAGAPTTSTAGASPTTTPPLTATPATPTTRRPTSSAQVATPPAGMGYEILPTPAGPSGTATGYRLPPLPTKKPAPLLGDTLPKPANAKGRLVAGFPAALAPPQGSAVESSSVSVASDVLQAALVATGADPLGILVHYRDVLSARGFVEQQTQGVENAPAAAFRKGRDNVTLTTVDGKTYLIANLRPKGA